MVAAESFATSPGESVTLARSKSASSCSAQGGESEQLIGEWLAARKNRSSLRDAERLGVGSLAASDVCVLRTVTVLP